MVFYHIPSVRIRATRATFKLDLMAVDMLAENFFFQEISMVGQYPKEDVFLNDVFPED